MVFVVNPINGRLSFYFGWKLTTLSPWLVGIVGQARWIQTVRALRFGTARLTPALEGRLQMQSWSNSGTAGDGALATS